MSLPDGVRHPQGMGCDLQNKQRKRQQQHQPAEQPDKQSRGWPGNGQAGRLAGLCEKIKIQDTINAIKTPDAV